MTDKGLAPDFIKEQETTTTKVKYKIQDPDQAETPALLRQRHKRKEEIEDVLGFALVPSASSSSSRSSSRSRSSSSNNNDNNSQSQQHQQEYNKMAPRSSTEETTSFLPTSSHDQGHPTKRASNCLPRLSRHRRKWIALCVITFVVVQIWAWGPDLVGRDKDWRMTFHSWQDSLRRPHDTEHRPPPPQPPLHHPLPPPPPGPPGPAPGHHGHAPPVPPNGGDYDPKAPLPSGYEGPPSELDDALGLASTAFPAKLATHYASTSKSIDKLYPKGDPHLGIIPAPLLAILDRDIPQVPPPRPSDVKPFPEERYTPHSGWSAAVNGSKTTYIDALNPAKQKVEADWRVAPYNTWKPPLEELSTRKKIKMPKVQHTFAAPNRYSGDQNDAERDEEISHRQRLVRNAFLHSWEGYKRLAWGHDELRPVSETPQDPFNGWGATIVDALDTLLVMDLPVEYDYARQHVRDIDFHLIGGGRSAYMSSDGRIPVFETVIRYLGGFLSAYDLSGDTLMMNRAEELAQLIMPAFDTSSGVAVGRIRFDWPLLPSAAGGGVVLAEAASMLLEMTRLWQVTGNRTYFDRVQRTTDWLDRNMTNTPSRLGTLWPTSLFPDRGTMYGWYTWGGMADSAFEYLIKEHQLLGGQLEQYGRMFADAMDSARQWLIRPVTTVSDTQLLVLGQSNGKTFEPKLEHLACFAGGSMALSGKLLPGRDRDMLQAKRFTETCYWAYNSTLTGIGPESCTFYKEKDIDRYSYAFEKDGTSRRGALNGAPIVGVRSAQPDARNRPETIESIFYLWRTTGDRIWQERGWQMFCSWVTHSMTSVGFSSISSVYEVPAYQTDNMESFVFAETFKYYYLLFSPPNTISLDDYVFTTEAHPLLVPQKGVWARAASGPKRMWDPKAIHTPSDPSAYSGGEMGPVGGLTSTQKAAIFTAWQADVNRNEMAKATAAAKKAKALAEAALKKIVSSPATAELQEETKSEKPV